METKHVLLLLGGEWHDFDGFAHFMRTLLDVKNWRLEATYDLERLTRLDREPCDLVLGYTCFTKHPDWAGDPGPDRLTDAQIEALTQWVRRGGAFLAAHAATVLGESNPSLGRLMGGVFVDHPPAFSFAVHPVHGRHPITAGIESFTVRDELYIERCETSVNLHMVAIDRGVAYPMVWSKSEGQGRVAHVALGHSAEVWELKPYRQLMLQTMQWLIGAKAAEDALD